MSFSSRTLALLIAAGEVAIALAAVVLFEFMVSPEPLEEESQTVAEAPKAVPPAPATPENKEAATETNEAATKEGAATEAPVKEETK